MHGTLAAHEILIRDFGNNVRVLKLAQFNPLLGAYVVDAPGRHSTHRNYFMHERSAIRSAHRAAERAAAQMVEAE